MRGAVKNCIYGMGRKTPALFPMLNSTGFTVRVSTRYGNSFLNDGVGNISFYNNPKNRNPFGVTATHLLGIDMGYANPFTGDVKLFLDRGLDDVYSIELYILQSYEPYDTRNKLHITDLKAFLNQFPKIESIKIDIYSYNTEIRKPTVIGDLAEIPDSTKYLYTRSIDVKSASLNLFLNLDNFSAGAALEKLWHVGSYNVSASLLNINGDLANLPSSIYFFKIERVLGSAVVTYTSGRTWPTNFDTFHLNKTLTTIEIDNLLMDLSNSVSSAVGDKIIFLRGTRSSASDAAVTYLTGLGFTVTIDP